MINPDYPTQSYGWNAFTYQSYDQPQNNTGFYYSGQPTSPFSASNTVAPGSRRAIGQQFAQNWNGQVSTPYGYAAPQQAQQPAQIAAPTNYPGATYGSLLSPNAFPQPPAMGQSPAPAFDCIYNTQGIGSTWDKSTSQTPVWDNAYTQERRLTPPPIDWTASQRPAQTQQPTYGYGYNATNINPACTPQFAQPNEDWLATVKNNFANL